MTSETIGFIGLGSQGGPMAARIAAAGLPLVVWGRRPEATQPFVAAGAEVAQSVAELGERCDHVGLCVLDDAAVSEVCDKLLPAMRPGSRVVMHSTILPESCVALAQRCAERSIGFIDAPVSGGGRAAAAGTLTVMCGGDRAVFDAALPVLQTFGKMIVLLGEAGAGQRAKIINNTLLAANMGLAHAAFAAAEALGLDHAAFGQLVCESSGRSYGFEIYARLPNPRGFALGAPLLVKDVGLMSATLPGNPGTGVLRDTAAFFLDEAMSTGSPS